MSVLTYIAEVSPKDKPLVWLSGEVKTPPLSIGSTRTRLWSSGYSARRRKQPRIRSSQRVRDGCASTTRSSHEEKADMERSKRKRLERAGWRVGSTADFLGLTAAEEALVEMKLTLGSRLRKARERSNLTQTALAKRMKSSQSRVAKMEAGDPTVSLDLLVHGLLAAGLSQREIANALAPRKKFASA